MAEIDIWFILFDYDPCDTIMHLIKKIKAGD